MHSQYGGEHQSPLLLHRRRDNERVNDLFSATISIEERCVFGRSFPFQNVRHFRVTTPSSFRHCNAFPRSFIGKRTVTRDSRFRRQSIRFNGKKWHNGTCWLEDYPESERTSFGHGHFHANGALRIAFLNQRAGRNDRAIFIQNTSE